MYSIFSFNKYKTFFSFLAAGFCPKNLAFARVRGCSPQPLGSYAYGENKIGLKEQNIIQRGV